MKKKILILLCCLFLCACEHKNNNYNEEQSENNNNKYTACEKQYSNGFVFYYLYYDNNYNMIRENYNSHSILNTLSEAINQENEIKENCELTKKINTNKNYDCEITRDGNSINYRTSMDANYNYEEKINELENEGYLCEEKDTKN